MLATNTACYRPKTHMIAPDLDRKIKIPCCSLTPNDPFCVIMKLMTALAGMTSSINTGASTRKAVLDAPALALVGGAFSLPLLAVALPVADIRGRVLFLIKFVLR